jgi:hypothetical protein
MNTEKLDQLWQQIVAAVAERDSYLTSNSTPPISGPPATNAELTELEKYWGWQLPPSYRTFLSLRNGVKNFAYDTPLLSTHQIINDSMSWDVVDELDPDLIPSVFAASEYSDLFFCFDYRHPKPDGELEVVIFTLNGAQERHPNFLAWLYTYLDVMQAGIDREKADREFLREQK